MQKFIHKFIRNDCAATAIEYGLILGALAVALMIALALMGDEIGSVFTNTGDVISGLLENQDVLE